MGHSAEGSERKLFLSGLFGKPESLPVLLLILLFVILYAAGPELRSSKHVFDPPWLLFALNTVFVTVLCLLIAGLCFRSFLRGGFLNVLLLGCGVLTFGLSSLVAGWLVRPPYDLNEAVTVHNIGVFCTAVFFFVSSLYTAFGISPDIGDRKRLAAVLAYAGVLATGTILTSAAMLQLTPPFFIAGEGPTVIRQVVLAVSATLLTLSAVLMMTVYSDRRSSGFILYFVDALLLLGTGLAAVALGSPGSPLNWLGRAAQYLGIAYLAGASMKALGEARSKRTTIEKALADFFRKVETHYRALIEMAADAIVSIDRKGKIILINPAAEEIFGYGRDEVIGQNLADLMVPEQSRDLFYACLSGETHRDTEMVLMRKNGSRYPAELSFSPEMKPDEGSDRTIIIRDVTERRRAEEAVRSTALFPIQNPQPVLRIHREGTLLFSNPAAEPILAEWRADSACVIPGPVLQTVEAALSEGVSRGLEIRIAGRDFSFVATPIMESHYANLYGWDVTDRKRAETELKESEERLRLAAQAAGFGAYDGDPATGRAYWSPELKTLFGLSPEEPHPVFPNEPSTFIHPKDRDRVYRAIQSSFDPRGSGLLDEEHRIRHANGEWRWVQVKGRTSFSGDGEERRPVRATGIVLDITERKQAEEALREAKEHLERRVQERTAELKAAALYARSLIEANLDPLVTINPEGRITDVNQATEQATGVPRDRLIGSDFSDYFTEPEAARAGYRKVFTEGQVRDYPLTIRNATGRLTDVLYHASIYRNEAGDVQGVFAAARDITELRKAEAALRKANESLEQRVSERTEALRHAKDYAETLIRTASVLIVGLDEVGNVQTFNDAAEKITGYTRTEMLGRNWFEVAVPRDRYPYVWDEFLRLQDNSIPSEFENPILTKDGRERFISWRNSEIREGDRRRGTLSFGIDITDRKEAEESLRASEMRMKAVADHLPVGVWFADETGKIVYGNEAGRQIWAGARYVDPEEYHVYRAWWAETGQPLDPEDWAVVRAVKKGETSLKEVLEIECFDGTRKTILNSAVPLKSGDGRISGVVVLNEDITERIEVEQALRRSEARYRSYIEVTGQMGWATNADGDLVDDAPGIRHYTGQTFDEIRGAGWSRALHPDDVEITLAVWQKAVEEKRGYETEYRLRRHDGVYRYFLARGVPVLQDDGSVREWVGTCIDITERRRQEEELRKLNRTLRALSRSNEALMRAEEESAFLEEVCRIVIQDCGYAMVWIGYAEDDEDKTVRPVAHAGFEEGYLETLNLTWADRERGRGPTGTAIRTGKPILCTDMLTDPRFAPWRDEAARRGYASSLALPLLDEGRAFGAVTIYSTQPDPFSEEEIELLSDMADDLTYGIASLRLRLQSRQTLRAMQESEARFRQLADSMPQLVWTAASDGRVDYFNRRLSLLTTHGPWRPYVHAGDYRRTVEAWKNAIRTGSPYEIEHRLQLADGRFRWFLTRAVPVPDEAGHVIKWYGTSTDVHDRKQAEEEREIARIETITEKNRLEALVKTLPVGVALVDTEGGTIQSNDMFEQVWGGQRPDTRSVDDYNKYKAWWIDSGRQVQPDEWASVRAVRKGEIVTGQLMKIERFDGTMAFVMNSAVPINDVDGRIAGSAVAILDITERIEAEEAMRQSEARFRLLSETAARLLVSGDPQELINDLCRDVMEHLDCQAFFNFMVDERAGRLRLNACAGIPEEEVRKLEWLDYGVAVCGCVARDNARIIAEDIFHTPDVRTELVRSYGIQAYCCHPLKAQDRLIGTLSFGTKTRAFFTAEEVELMRTVADQVAVALQRVQAQQDLRASEEALRLANEQLEQRVRERTTELILLLEDLEKGRDDLRKLASELVLTEERERKKISVLLHDEVAQALAATKMRLDLLVTAPGGDDFRLAVMEAQDLLGQSIRQTRALMTDISNPVLYDMGLRVAVEALAEEVTARQGISVSCSFGGRLRNLGQDMEVMIFQVVKELVQNIVKHSRARNASIRLVEEKSAVCTVVADDGRGFDAGMSSTVQSEGGFGLFSIRERVKSYGGKIHIKSEPGRGSEVTVKLPKEAAGNKASLKTRNGKKGA